MVDMGRTKNSLKGLFVLASLFITISGCSKRYDDLPAYLSLPFYDSENTSVGRFKTSYLADQIHAYFRGSSVGTLAVSTFVDLDNLYTTSTFGRLLAEQVMSELIMKGYNVVEVRQSNALQVLFDQGEFGLSREVSRIRSHQDISGLVVGTYSVSPDRVYVNVRVVDPATAMIVSTGSVEMAKTSEIAKMLRNSTNANAPSSLERMPVMGLNTNGYIQPIIDPRLLVTAKPPTEQAVKSKKKTLKDVTLVAPEPKL